MEYLQDNVENFMYNCLAVPAYYQIFLDDSKEEYLKACNFVFDSIVKMPEEHRTRFIFQVMADIIEFLQVAGNVTESKKDYEEIVKYLKENTGK